LHSERHGDNMLTKKKDTKNTEPADTSELMAFDKRKQMKEKPKKQGFGSKPAAKEEAPAEAPLAGTFFKPKKVEKKSSFGRK
jgi:hypothetical protein